MKKMVVVFLVVALVSSFSILAFGEDVVHVILDGNYIGFDVNPQIIDGRTMVPIRSIFEHLGATVEWNGNTKTAVCTKGDTVVEMKVDDTKMFVNDQVTLMDTCPVIINDRILAPVRYVAEAFGADVQWKQRNKTVVISAVEGETSVLSGKIIVIDAGHGKNSYNKYEPIAPNSSETKIAFATGTSGARQSEEQLNLSVSLKLQDLLESKGAIVHMTRTEHESDMTNVDRAVFANDLNADISVKIHADGNNSASAHGVSVLVPGNLYIKDNDLLEKSKAAGQSILDCFVKETGAYNRGVIVRNDLTGFNWTKVPIVLIEMGFMTNPQEDKLMETDEYQIKMVKGMAEGLEQYFSGR